MYWEYAPATREQAAQAYAWIAARMSLWLEANGADSSDSQAWREREEAQELYNSAARRADEANRRADALQTKVELLEAEYARLRKTAEPPPHRAAAANPPLPPLSIQEQLELLEIEYARLKKTPHPLATASVDLPAAPRWRAASELNEHACVLRHWMARYDLEPYRKAVDVARERQRANPSVDRSSILFYDLKDYARRLPTLLPSEPCAKPCCADLALVEAELAALRG